MRPILLITSVQGPGFFLKRFDNFHLLNNIHIENLTKEIRFRRGQTGRIGVLVQHLVVLEFDQDLRRALKRNQKCWFQQLECHLML